MAKTNLLSSFVDNSLTILLSKEKWPERLFLLLIAVGFIVRLIAALNLGVLADDMIYASQSAGILSAGLLSTHSHPPLYFYLNDLAYQLLGYTTLASRFFSLIFGTLLLGVMFLIVQYFSNTRVALASTFFLAFSNFLVRMTFTEQSLVTFFFIFFGVYFCLLYLKSGRLAHIIPSAILFGLGTLTKYNAVFFLIPMFFYALYYQYTHKQKILSKKNIQHAALFIAIILVFSLPFLLFNYFIYKDKGIVDFQFTRIFKPEKAQELFGALGGQDKSYVESFFFLPNYHNYSLLYHTDWVLMLFAIAGIVLLARKKEYSVLWFIGLFILIPFALQSAANSLTKHFVFITLVAALPAGYALTALVRRIRSDLLIKGVIIILLIIFLITLHVRYGTPSDYISPSSESQLKSYLYTTVSSEELIVFDARIYTAKNFWFATPHHFLSSFDFVNFYNQYNRDLADNLKRPTKVYFVECAKDDCGWGTIASQPDLNASSEAFFEGIRNQSTLAKTITEKPHPYMVNQLFSDEPRIDAFKVYVLTIPLNPGLVEQTDRINAFYFAPYLYKDMTNYIFNYKLESGFDKVLNFLGYAIIIVSLILSLLSIAYLIQLLVKSN